MNDEIFNKIKIIDQGKFDLLPDPYLQGYKGYRNDNYGEEIINVGSTLLKFIIEVIKKDEKKGAEFISYLSLGYPNKENTDLYFAIQECVNLQRLYINSARDYGFKDLKIQALVINAYFRWYCSVYETYKKALVYCISCHKFCTNQEFKDIDNYLFNTGNPGKVLRSETSSKIHELILKYFNGEIRHSISHSNIMLLKGVKDPNLFSVAVRFSSDDKKNSEQLYFDTFLDFAKSVDKDISIMYQSLRFFLEISNGFIINCYGEKYNEYLGGEISVPPLTQRIMKDGPLF